MNINHSGVIGAPHLDAPHENRPAVPFQQRRQRTNIITLQAAAFVAFFPLRYLFNDHLSRLPEAISPGTGATMAVMTSAFLGRWVTPKELLKIAVVAYVVLGLDYAVDYEEMNPDTSRNLHRGIHLVSYVVYFILQRIIANEERERQRREGHDQL